MTDLVPRDSTPANFIDEWERQPNERGKCWTAFQVFRDMGEERGVFAVRDKAGFPVSHSTLVRWADKYRWMERAAAYDRHIDRQRVRAHVAEVEAMARRQVQIGQVLQEKGLEWVKTELLTPAQRKEALNANSALRFIDKGVDLEREGLGLNDNDPAGETNLTINVLDAGTKGDVFDKINQMAENAKRVEDMMRARSMLPAEEIVDAELVEDDEE